VRKLADERGGARKKIIYFFHPVAIFFLTNRYAGGLGGAQAANDKIANSK